MTNDYHEYHPLNTEYADPFQGRVVELGVGRGKLRIRHFNSIMRHEGNTVGRPTFGLATPHINGLDAKRLSLIPREDLESILGLGKKGVEAVYKALQEIREDSENKM